MLVSDQDGNLQARCAMALTSINSDWMKYDCVLCEVSWIPENFLWIYFLLSQRETSSKDLDNCPDKIQGHQLLRIP